MTDRLPEAKGESGRGARANERASATLSGAVPAVLGRAVRAREGVAPHRPEAATLGDAQRWLVSAITSAEPGDAEAASWLTAGPRLSARERLEIYRSGYVARLVECILDDYPAVAAAMGDDAFHALCHDYVERFPSRSPSLNAYSRHLPELVREYENGAFLADLARLEWALVEVLHEESSPKFDFSRVAALPPESWADLRFTKATEVRFLRFDHPANAFYQAWRTSDAVPELPAEVPSAAVVYRKDMRLWRMELTLPMARVLEALFDGVALGPALERMGTDGTDPAALAEAERTVMIWFREWIEGGLMVPTPAHPRRREDVSG